MKMKSKFLQKSFFTFQNNGNREFLVLIELSLESELPIGTSIVPVPPRIFMVSNFQVVLN